MNPFKFIHLKLKDAEATVFLPNLVVTYLVFRVIDALMSGI